MNTYVARSHLPRICAAQIRDQAARAGAAADALAAEGVEIRHMSTTFVPQEEAALHVFEADSPQSVEKAMRRASIAPDDVLTRPRRPLTR